MAERWMCLLPIIAMLGMAASTRAQDLPERQTIDTPAGPMTAALTQLSIQTHTGLLFSPELVGARLSPRVAGRMTLEEALQRLLTGTDLGYRRTSAGTVLIFALSSVEESVALPEILVVGRRTQNEDIRRTENDIQPYQVTTARALRRAPADTIDQFLRARLPSDATPRAAAQNPINEQASNRSEINLHGLGANQTLVLIDGVRMPPFPKRIGSDTLQPDLNGLPLLAIDRIETLTGTAGGIYGPGATGGVVNVILRRAYRGAEFSTTYGLSERGDAPKVRFDGQIGFTPDDGRTEIMLAVSHAATKGLRAGDRAFVAQARSLESQIAPSRFLDGLPAFDGILVRTLSGDLSLKPALGGAALGAAVTSFPLGYSPFGGDAGALMIANAGRIPTALASDAAGARQTLTTTTNVDALLLNVRHRFGGHLEAFIDLVGFQNDGDSVTRGNVAFTPILASAPTNPFQQTVVVTFPMSNFDGTTQSRMRTIRLSVGALAHLPKQWSAEGRFTAGWVRNVVDSTRPLLSGNFTSAAIVGQAGAGGEPVPNPFAPWSSFQAALEAYPETIFTRDPGRSQLTDVTLRLAGPVAHLPAGDVTLSLLAEHRRENIPTRSIELSEWFQGVLLTNAQIVSAFSQNVSSAYGEARVPIYPREGAPSLLRGLELQLAARYDRVGTRVPIVTGIASDDHFQTRDDTLAFTAGLRVFPLRRLMLRASLATGVVPPAVPVGLLPATGLSTPVPDPKRGGRLVGSEGPWPVSSSTPPLLAPADGRTLSLGAVINDDDAQRWRLSLDYTHIETWHETVPSAGLAYLLGHEERFSDRIQRAPLTADDIAQGFTGGVIARIDARPFNAGKTVVDVLDLRGDYRLSDVANGRLTLSGAATWQPRLRLTRLLDGPAVNLVGFADGPLRWRGNIGVDWERGPLTLSLNGQYYGRYHALDAPTGALSNADRAELTLPGVRVPPQFYVDALATYRFDLPATALLRNLEVRFGVANLFDRAPPIVVSSDYDAGYSYYGDARGRRFELTLSTRF